MRDVFLSEKTVEATTAELTRADLTKARDTVETMTEEQFLLELQMINLGYAPRQPYRITHVAPP